MAKKSSRRNLFSVVGEAHYGVMAPELPEASSDANGEPMTAIAARFLRQKILDGEMNPGERITQDAVARRLGISRLPVREALRELASEGLVTIQPDVGARVAKVDPRELVEVYQMREAIEPMAVAEGARRITPELLETLRGYLDESEAHARKQDWAQYSRFDRLFHGTLFDLADMPHVRRVIEGLWVTSHQYRRVYALLPQRLEVSAVEHRLLLDALERGAADDASAIHLVHIRRVRHALSKSISEEGPARERRRTRSAIHRQSG